MSTPLLPLSPVPHSFAFFGLMAWLEETRIQLPLRAVDCRFRVTGEVAVVEVDQVFQQTAAESLNVTYTFPLPHGAAVYRCEMHVNGRVIRARVMEKEQARRVVEEQKQLGHRTALVQADRENIFRLELGNLAPGDIVVLRLAYLQALGRTETQLSLSIPFCPGIRYIPGEPLLRANHGKGTQDDTDQVPDASCISPPRIDRFHPDAAELHLEGVLDGADVSLVTLSSPTHPVIVRPEAGTLQVRLAEAEALPDRDFVMRWEESAVAQAQTRTWSTRDEKEIYALMQLRAPREVAVQEAWEQDIYFLVDRSGSMQGKKWTKCAEALTSFVKELGKKDRVWITLFASDHQDFSEAPMLAAKMLADKGFKNIAKLEAEGGTALLPALEHVLKVRKRSSTGRRSRMVIITDGEVGNDAPILKCLYAEKNLPVYCFGIDTAVNDSFLKLLSSRHGGRCVLMTPNDDIPAAVHRLARALRRPVLTDLRVSEGWTTGDGMVELPDLNEGEITLVAARATEGAPPLRVTGKMPDGSVWSSEAVLAPDDDPAPRLVWAQRRISSLLADYRNAEAVALAVEYNLACVGASFVAWDDSEKVPVAQREVYQPSLMMDQMAAPMVPMPCMAPPPAEGGAGFAKARGSITQLFHAEPPSRSGFAKSDPMARIRAVYVKSRWPAWLGGSKAIPKQWAELLQKALGGSGVSMKKLTALLGWLLYDWSCHNNAAVRHELVTGFLEAAARDAVGPGTVESFLKSNLQGAYRTDAQEVMRAIHEAAASTP